MTFEKKGENASILETDPNNSISPHRGSSADIFKSYPSKYSFGTVRASIGQSFIVDGKLVPNLRMLKTNLTEIIAK